VAPTKKNALNKTQASQFMATVLDFSTIFTTGGVIHEEIQKAKLYMMGRIYFGWSS
jgi:hypothetical protein